MTIRTELNPYLETLGLLYLSAHPEKASRSFLVSEANELGIDGDALYRKFGPVHKRYVSAFQKQWNREEISAMAGFDFFFDTDDWPPFSSYAENIPIGLPQKGPLYKRRRFFWPLSIRSSRTELSQRSPPCRSCCLSWNSQGFQPPCAGK